MKKTQIKRMYKPNWMMAISLVVPFCATAWSQEAEPEEEIFELSPFEVKSSEDDIGYRQQNTLAGSRMSTNIADLASSISIVTKEQMEDTASLDVNDLFRYEAGTEGSSTYTPGLQTSRGDGLADTGAGYSAGFTGATATNASSNTVRGLGSPDSSINFYRSIRQIPLDSYNVQSVEISRGPNSMLFGIGSPAGVVNQSRSQAVLDQESLQVKLRVDDRGSKRGSISFNKPLIENKLAFFGALLRDEEAFERKPSYDDSERFYGTITYRPFEKTTFRGSFENYENDNRRPNSITPVDYVSEWRDAGSPVYDPTTRMVTITDTGEQVGPYVNSSSSPFMDDIRDYIRAMPGYDDSLWSSSDRRYNGVNIYGSASLTDPNSALYVPGIEWVTNRPTMQIANGEVVNWFQGRPSRYRPVFGTDSNPAANAGYTMSNGDIYGNAVTAPVYDQNWTVSTNYLGDDLPFSEYRYSGVTDKSIYDWTSTNILQMNFGREEARTYNLEWEQQITPDLYLTAGWFRQDFENTTSYTVSQLNASAIYVDTNQHLPDGSENPYFGQPYVRDVDPDRFTQDVTNDQYRAIVAYTPDFTEADGWTKWLGKHQFLAFASREKETRDTARKRLMWTASQEDEQGMIRFLPNPNNDVDGDPTGWSFESGGKVVRSFYLSSPGTSPYGTITQGSGEWNLDSYTGSMSVYNWEEEAFRDVSYSMAWNDFSTGTESAQTQIDSWNIGGTSYLWNDRIVATYGLRSDEAKNRQSTNGTILDQDGNVVAEALENSEIWVDGMYDTQSLIRRYNRWDSVKEETTTAGVVFKPFSGWDSIDQKAKEGSVFHGFLSTLGFTYNKSDTFNPPNVPYVDAFGNLLPKPSGNGEDIGVQFSLFENKLFARISRFESTNDNDPGGAGRALGRFRSQIDTNNFREWARTIALINMGRDPSSEDFYEVAATDEAQVEAATEEIWGLEYDYYGNLPGELGQTQSISAKGTELQINYNPVKNWTIKLTGSKQETIYDNIAPEFDDWFNYRQPMMVAANASDYLLPEYQDLARYETSSGRQVNLTNFWASYGYTSAARIEGDADYASIEEYYNGIVNPGVAYDKGREGTVVTNQPEYRASLITNYKFVGDKFKGFSVGGSYRWIDQKSIGYYGKSSGEDPDLIDISDLSRPVYVSDETYVDIWAAYRKKVFNDSVNMKIQLNVENVFEDGGLQPVRVNFDGQPYAYRIIDPRRFILSVSFDM